MALINALTHFKTFFIHASRNISQMTTVNGKIHTHTQERKKIALGLFDFSQSHAFYQALSKSGQKGKLNGTVKKDARDLTE